MKIGILVLILILIVPLASAIDLIPTGNIRMSPGGNITYNMTNITYLCDKQNRCFNLSVMNASSSSGGSFTNGSDIVVGRLNVSFINDTSLAAFNKSISFASFH